MALTTNDAAKIEQNVVTDIKPTSDPSLERARRISPDAAILFDKSIVARPLMVPEVCSIHIKNTEYQYRWVNRGSQSGRYYMQRRAQGFTNATLADIDVLGGDVVGTNGEVTAGDLILMKIRRDIYDGAMKYNMQKAAQLTAARGMYMEGASGDVMSDSVAKRVSVANEPYARSGLAQPFIPDNPDALVQDSISAGRAEVTRKQQAEMRASHQAKG